jgi:hypothetical protein
MTKHRKRGKAKGSAAAPKSAVSLAVMPIAWDLGATAPASPVGAIMEVIRAASDEVTE